uniref:Uncharacterized protein n=1 Tax=Arundo donax TaxID=35708 RepID=A0A0A9AKN1_ARUDO
MHARRAHLPAATFTNSRGDVARHISSFRNFAPDDG